VNHRSLSLSGRCERVARMDVFGCQIGEVLQYRLLGHPRRQVAEDIVNRDSHAAYAGLPSAHGRVYGDDVLISHVYDFTALWFAQQGPKREAVIVQTCYLEALTKAEAATGVGYGPAPCRLSNRGNILPTS